MRFTWAPPALMVAAGLALQPSISLAQSNIGSAASVRNQVEGVLGGRTNTLSSGSAVHSNELIRSGDGAVANLVFVDETKLSVGPKSEVRLDKFAYDPNKNTGTVVVRATRGAYRFVTGVQDPRNYEIKTPYATLGVRGTILEVNLEGWRTKLERALEIKESLPKAMVSLALCTRPLGPMARAEIG